MTKYLRTNYRLTGGKEDFPIDAISSILVCVKVTIQHDSAAGDVVTFSMQGYGVPEWVKVVPGQRMTFTFLAKVRTSIAASLVYLTVDGMSGSMGSLDATLSYRYNVLALIASR